MRNNYRNVVNCCLFILATTTGCGSGKFYDTDSVSKQVYRDQDEDSVAKYPPGITGGKGIVVFPCDIASNTSLKITNEKNKLTFSLPQNCTTSILDTTASSRNLDIVFVLDVTGSMGKEIQAVRNGFKNLTEYASAKDWKIRVGAVGFADTIQEEIPLNSDVAKTYDLMANPNSYWAAPPGVGGDEQEIGLGAIEKGISMLESSDIEANSTTEKILVYVSDAPAQRVHKDFGGYETTETAQKINILESKLRAQGSSLRIFYSASSNREKLNPLMPTPSEQLDELIISAKVSGVKLPYPFIVKSFTDGIIPKVAEGKVKTQECILKNIELINEKKEAVSLINNTVVTQPGFLDFQTAEILPHATYAISVNRTCTENKTQVDSLELILD